MIKFRVFVDMKKEEQYLNEMAAKGWGLVKYNMFSVYTFKKITPETRNYRIDYQTFKRNADFIDYVTLFEDSGWQHVSGTKNSGVQFFLPKDSDMQAEDIFSDATSSKRRYKRMYEQAMFWVTLMVVYFVIFKDSLASLPNWYLAPSLFAQYSGMQLFAMIIMETLFAIIQILPMGIFVGIMIYYAVVSVKLKKLMKE